MRGLFIIVAAIIFLSSCASVKKQRSRAHDFFREHPIELAELCGDKFPVQIEYRPGKEIIKSDTTVIKDTVTVTVDCPDGTQVDCPPNQKIIIRDTIRTRDTLLRENTARIEEFRLKSERAERLLIVEQALRGQAEKRAKNRGWVIGGILVLIAARFILKTRRII